MTFTKILKGQSKCYVKHGFEEGKRLNKSKAMLHSGHRDGQIEQIHK